MGFFDSIKDIYDDIEDEVKRAASSIEQEWNRSSDLERGLVIGGAVAAPLVIGGMAAGTAGASGLPYIADSALPAILQPAGSALTASGLPYIADSALPAILQPAGIGGFLGDVVAAVPGAITTLANVLPSIETVFGGDESAGPIPRSTSPPGSTQPLILQTGAGQQAGQEQPIPGQRTGAAQPVFYQTPAAEGGSPNMMLYIGIAVIAYFLLR